MKRRIGRWLLLLTLSGPTVVTLSCGSNILLAEARDIGLGIMSAVLEGVALNIVERIGLADLIDGGTTTP
jgi:hypothetical protein